MLTNRPDYAPERRAGDPTDIMTAAYDLVTLHATIQDAYTIAALIDAGSAALEHAPARATDLVEIANRRRMSSLGFAAAAALRAEAIRSVDRNNDRYVDEARRRKAADRKAERDRQARALGYPDSDDRPQPSTSA